MADDIVPKLLDDLKKEFLSKYKANKKIPKLLETKNHANAYLYAQEVGEILAEVFDSKLSASILPEGKMYFNIAERILNDTLGNNHKLVTEYAVELQTALNKEAGIGLKPKTNKVNQDRIDGLVNRLSTEDNFDEVKWILKDPVANFSRSVMDDFVMTNADFHAKAGLKPKITRYVNSEHCEWCDKLAGTYDYPVDRIIYARHENCDCVVEYHPKDGRGIQNSHTKGWR